ncbi:MAG: PAS domain S-box protein [Thermomicrobiales bacterium]
MTCEEPAIPDGRDASRPGAPGFWTSTEVGAANAVVSSATPEAALLSAVLAASPIAAAVVAPDLTLLEVNQALCGLVGYRPEELLGTSLWELRHPGEIVSRLNGRSSVPWEARNSFDEQQRFRHRDGRMVTTRVKGSVLPRQVGCPQTYLLYVQDPGEPLQVDAGMASGESCTGQAVDLATDGFFALDREWRVTYINEAAAQILEQPRSALLGSNIWDVFPRAAESPFFMAADSALEDGIAGSVDHRCSPKGTSLTIHVRPAADGLSVFLQVGTLPQEPEPGWGTSDAKQRFILDHVPAVLYALAPDAEDTPLYFSPHHQELTGYTLEETLAGASNWLDLVHPDDRPRTAAENARSLAAGEKFQAEYRFRRKDGSYVWILDECVPVRDSHGDIISWQGVLLDITDRMAAQDARAHLASLVMSAEDAIISSDLDGLITSWNPGATRLYGYSEAEMLGTPFDRLLPSEIDRDELASRIRAVRSGAAVELFESQRQREDGTVIDVAIPMSPIRSENDTIIGLSTITRDVSDRNRVEQALRDALHVAETTARTKSLFLAMMSHELRTPVQSVLGYAELLLLDPEVLLTPDQLTDLTCIRDGARRLSRLIDHLLDLSRLEAGLLVLDLKPVAAADIVEVVRRDIITQVQSKHLSLEIDVPAALPLALCDPVRLRQIVLNLAENAVKFTDEGLVSIRGYQAENRLAIEVTDTGIGIAPDALPTIFEEFRQVDDKLTRRYGGAGLGLAIAQRLANLMQCTLSVSSEVGKGSRFVLEVPIAPE